MRMDPNVKRLWIEALRSGKYRQGRGSLHSINEEYCCLGVLCALAEEHGVSKRSAATVGYGYGYAYDGNTAILPSAVRSWAGLDNENPLAGGVSLVLANDNLREDFNQIADRIEAHL